MTVMFHFQIYISYYYFFRAYDTQLYLPLKPHSPSDLNCPRECLEDIKSWMTLSFLQLNDDKSEAVLLAPLTPLNYSPIT